MYVLNGVAAYDVNVFPWILLGDVWASSDGGLSWHQPTGTTPWSALGNGRMESAATSYYSSYYNSDVIYSMGGCSTTSTSFNVASTSATLTEVGYNDVYAVHQPRYTPHNNMPIHTSMRPTYCRLTRSHAASPSAGPPYAGQPRAKLVYGDERCCLFWSMRSDCCLQARRVCWWWWGGRTPQSYVASAAGFPTY